jgi:ParB-like chromosome segregation protein Spo0J
MPLEVQSVPIDTLHADPANVNTHPARSISAIKASLARFGQQKAVVCDSAGVVRAGNGTLEAAKALGWTHLDVVISDLKGSELTAYAIADNRSAQFGVFDNEALAITLRSLADEDFDLGDLGFTEDEITALGGEIGSAEPEGDGSGGEEEILAEKWMVVIECRDEPHQVDLLQRFKDEGLACRAIVS